jgi:hypothetical protein
MILLLVSASSGLFLRYHCSPHRRGMTPTDRHGRGSGSGERIRQVDPTRRHHCDPAQNLCREEGNRKRSPVMLDYAF